jgi:hypothetical protein
MTKFTPFARLMTMAFCACVYAAMAMPVLEKAAQMA